MVDFFARRLWWSMLWFMRRPFIRKMQRGSIQILPEKFQDRAWQNFRKQEGWARENGLMLIRLMIGFLLLSIGFTTAWMITLEMMNAGWIPSGLN